MSDKQIDPKDIIKNPQDVVLCAECGTEYNRLSGSCPQCSDQEHADPMWHEVTGK